MAPVEDVAGARQACGEVGALTGIAAPVAPHPVAEAVVPFGEAGRMVAELVAAGTDVPRLGDQLYLLQDRILADRVEEAGAGIEAVGLAPQGHAQIEAEAVDMEGRDPVAQRIHDHLQDARRRQVAACCPCRCR